MVVVLFVAFVLIHLHDIQFENINCFMVVVYQTRGVFTHDAVFECLSGNSLSCTKRQHLIYSLASCFIVNIVKLFISQAWHHFFCKFVMKYLFIHPTSKIRIMQINCKVILSRFSWDINQINCESRKLYLMGKYRSM